MTVKIETFTHHPLAALILLLALLVAAVSPAVHAGQAPTIPKSAKPPKSCATSKSVKKGPQPPAPAAPQPPSGPLPPGPQPPTATPGTGKSLESSPTIGKIEKLFTSQPHFIVQSIVPGSGTGGGAQVQSDFNRDPWMARLSLTGLATIREFSMGEIQLRLAHNPWTPWPRALNEESKAQIRLYARTRKLPQMPFYGLGPNASLANQAFFGERDSLVGVNITDPLATHFDLGGRVESIWNSVGPPSTALTQSILALYPTTPGLSGPANLAHYEIYAHAHFKSFQPYELDYKVSYGYYQDHRSDRFSFRRLKVNLYNNYYPFHTKDQNCDRIPNRDIFITLHGLLIASDTSAGNSVPFYLMPTLGGSDANTEPTLRGFKDFQFRGPDAVLVQVEYNHRLWKNLGAFAFYDAGKVGFHVGDLTNLRQSYGLGTSFWMNDAVLFKIYVGLGSGAGAHPYFGIPSFTGDNLVTGRGPAATPWD